MQGFTTEIGGVQQTLRRAQEQGDFDRVIFRLNHALDERSYLNSTDLVISAC